MIRHIFKSIFEKLIFLVGCSGSLLNLCTYGTFKGKYSFVPTSGVYQCRAVCVCVCVCVRGGGDGGVGEGGGVCVS